jgi:hypothetical protein
MASYLRETVAEIDEVMAYWLTRREQMAVKIAALEAAENPAVIQAAEDYAQRVAEGRPYEDAEDASDLLSEAYRRFAQ